MDADGLDQRSDLRLGTAQADLAIAGAKPAREQREIDHQRDIGEDEFGEIDVHVGLRAQRSRDGATPDSLCGAVLISGAAEDGR
jgi:hypothetical protein